MLEVNRITAHKTIVLILFMISATYSDSSTLKYFKNIAKIDSLEILSSDITETDVYEVKDACAAWFVFCSI